MTTRLKAKTISLFIVFVGAVLTILNSNELFNVLKSHQLSPVLADSTDEWIQKNANGINTAFLKRTVRKPEDTSIFGSKLSFDNIHPKSDPGAKSIEIRLKEELKTAQEKECNILIWNPLQREAVRTLQNVDAKKCGNCKILLDKSKLNEPTTKAVVFVYENLKVSNLPARRSDQYFVGLTMEAPPALFHMRGISLKQFDGVFNLTMTHRRDSDVYFPYATAGILWKRYNKLASNDKAKDIHDMILSKQKLALWVVSNCNHTAGARKRMAYTDQLVAAGLSLDRFGKCFPQSGQILNINITKMYKFYFAFENSIHCKDYITEKLFKNALNMEAVPVVMGATKPDYEAVVPPGSCIYVEDFESPADLVKYLNYLDENITAYKEYFKWRTMPLEDMPQHNRTKGFCNLCRILHGVNVDNIHNPTYNASRKDIPLFGYSSHPRIVSSLDKWFYGSENKECLAKN